MPGNSQLQCAIAQLERPGALVMVETAVFGDPVDQVPSSKPRTPGPNWLQGVRASRKRRTCREASQPCVGRVLHQEGLFQEKLDPGIPSILC